MSKTSEALEAMVPEDMVAVDRAKYDRLNKARVMLAALVKQSGRVRISKRDLTPVEGSKLDVKVQENGDLVVTFVEG